MFANLKQTHRANGFTLIEISIVIIVFGVLLGLFFPLYNLYRFNVATEQTEDRITELSNAMGAFRAANGRYPCPASPNAARNNPAYGREDTDQCSIADPLDPAKIAINSCDAATGLCVYASNRTIDTDSDGTPDFTPRVIIGSIPFRQLNLQEDTMVDGFGRRFTYAVTENLARQEGFNQNLGGIEIIDENGNSMLRESASEHLVIISHGENGYGAYLAEGGAQIPCNESTGIERENCINDGDAIFQLAQRSENKTNGREYDDLISAYLLQDLRYFRYTDTETDDANMSVDGTANVGVSADTNTAGHRLFVPNGSIRGRERIDVSDICGGDSTTCFESSLLGGPEGEALECDNPNEFVVGISGNDVICTDDLHVECPAGQFVIGINADGTLDCSEPAYCQPIQVDVCTETGDVGNLPEALVGERVEVTGGDARRVEYECVQYGDGTPFWEPVNESGVCVCIPEDFIWQDDNGCGECALPGSYVRQRIQHLCPQDEWVITDAERNCRCAPTSDGSLVCGGTERGPCPPGYTSTRPDGYGYINTWGHECVPDGANGYIGDFHWSSTDTWENCVCDNDAAEQRNDECGNAGLGTVLIPQTRHYDCATDSWGPWEDDDPNQRANECSCADNTRERDVDCATNGYPDYDGTFTIRERIGMDTECLWVYDGEVSGGNNCTPRPPVPRQWIPLGGVREDNSTNLAGHRAYVNTNCTPGQRLPICYTVKVSGSLYTLYNDCECQ